MAKKKGSKKKDKEKEPEDRLDIDEDDEEDLFGIDQEDEEPKDEGTEIDIEDEEEEDDEEEGEEEEEEGPKPKKKKKKKKKGKKMDTSQMFFFIGSALSVFSALMAIFGILWMMRVEPMRKFFLTDFLDGIPLFYYGCCLLTLFFVFTFVAGLVLVLKSLQPKPLSTGVEDEKKESK